MTKITRKFQAGDDVHINRLYKLITGIDRTEQEYAWEWLETWDGMGSIWLVFDDSREPNDQLIAQYSLIPTPFSFWGKKVKAGKTENCMSHPDFRGKGMYFHHERDCFEIAKKSFQIFFTTTGHVARGAPGKVRKKLGYVPFDDWVTYSYWLDRRELAKEISSKLPITLRKRNWLNNSIAHMISKIIVMRSKIPTEITKYDIRLYPIERSPLEEIEQLWNRNAELYGISVDRTADYLKWRINENPYISHHYLCYYEENILQGYIIFSRQDTDLYIVDLLANQKDNSIFINMFDHLKSYGIEKACHRIKCHTPSLNKFLIQVLSVAKFVNYADLFTLNIFKQKTPPKQLFVYVSDEIESEKDIWDNGYWYFTDIVKEGRPYTVRPIDHNFNQTP
ncbi:MAG: GNAT family N-acetyltransferase [Candidatus Marinimicrobia bacterium]|nr:GNAT family N-acetyltransferase [Candidatus Neomarinimicrobiota bacterium]